MAKGKKGGHGDGAVGGRGISTTKHFLTGLSHMSVPTQDASRKIHGTKSVGSAATRNSPGSIPVLGPRVA